MQSGSRSFTMVILLALIASVVGCRGTFSKVEKQADGHVVTHEVTQQADWWQDLGSPDMMGIKHERTLVDGVVTHEIACDHVPTRPDLLSCVEVK